VEVLVGDHPVLDDTKIAKNLVIRHKIYKSNRQVHLPTAGNSTVSLFSASKGKGLNRNPCWCPFSRTAKIELKILYSPCAREERTFQVSFQMFYRASLEHEHPVSDEVVLLEITLDSKKASRR